MDKVVSLVEKWEHSNIDVFWGEIAPCDHLVQIYDLDSVFLSTLESFVSTGFLANESIVIIATHNHLSLLNERLNQQGFDLDALITTDQYIPLDVHESLAKFLLNNWPDEILFNTFIGSIIDRASKDNRKIRAFGEMVAVLWEQGHNGATVQLENLWNQLHSKKHFTLYCAYPKSGFTQNATESIDTICKTHSKIIEGQTQPSTEIYYRNC